MLNKLLAPCLRWPLAAFIGCLALATITYSLAIEARHQAGGTRAAALRTWHEARHKLDQLPKRLETVRTSGSLHGNLVQRGFIGSEQRLQWISTLARLQSEMQLDHLDWRLEPQSQSVTVPGLNVSRMHIRATPMDAARLSSFLDGLAHRARGHFTVDQCTLTLADRQNPQVECTLSWWTWQAGQEGA